MSLDRYRGWAQTVVSPKQRLLPAVGARLGAYPRVAAGVFVALRHLPGTRLRAAAEQHVSRPLLGRMRVELEVPVDGGFRMRVDSTDAIGRALAVTGGWERHLVYPFQALLSPGDICIDVGANIGYHTLLAATLVGPSGHVHAMEPAADTFAALLANLKLNELANVTPHRVAAGATEGEAELDVRPFGQSLHSFVRREDEARPPQVGGVTVPVRTIASLIGPSDVGRVRLIKIDVEGYDAEALKGLEPLYESGGRPALIIELHPQGAEALPLLARLAERYGLQPRKLYDEEGFGVPIQLTAPLELGREPHLLLFPGGSR